MIKTVSFAPPRAPRASKSAGKNASSRVIGAAMPAKSPLKVQDGTASALKVQDSSVQTLKVQDTKKRASKTSHSPATLDVSEVRAALQKSAAPAKKPRAAKLASPTEAAPIEAATTEAAPTEAAAIEAINAPKTDATSVAKARAETGAPAAKIVEGKAAPVARRSRVPKDLAAQYGAAPATDDGPRHAVVETAAPRKRLTRAKKEARSQLLRADDNVLQRLQQANAIEAKKPASRGRGWEFECGCCGRVTRFQTPAALCECGAIAVKE